MKYFPRKNRLGKGRPGTGVTKVRRLKNRSHRWLQTEALEERNLLAADLIGDFVEEISAQVAIPELVSASSQPSTLSFAVEDTGQITSRNTQADLAKPNHSPVFFHDDAWWGVFRSNDDGDWWLWRRDSESNWSQTSLLLGTSGSDRPDVIVDAEANRMVTFFSHASNPDVFSATYNGTNWSIDPLINGVEVPGMEGTTDQSVIALATRWSTPTLFAFRYADTSLVANWSTDYGRTWEASTTTIADGSQGMSESRGLVDATEFSWDDGAESQNYVAVAYGENSQGQFGLITLREGDSLADSNSWDHTVLPELADGARSDDHISITRDGSSTNNRLYIVGKTEGGGSDSSNHALFVRDNNPTGSIALTNFDAGQSRPAVVFDSTNDELYVISTNASGGNVAYRKSPTPAIDFSPEQVFIENGGDDFINGGTSHTPVNSTSGLLYVAGNKSDDDIWENHFSLGPIIPVPGVAVTPSSGLITSEDGSVATFSVKLKAEPTAPVTLPIVSSNPNEGTVNKSLLTFTAANWNEPQIVTITGIDDEDQDGSVAYSIQIGPASGAAEYIGIDAANPAVVNLDNDQPIPSASLFFSVDDDGTIGQGLEVTAEDIILDDGSQFEIYFDGSDVGLDGFSLGAFDILSPNEILFAFEKSQSIPGVGNVLEGDVVKFTATQLGDTTAGSFELYFNSASVGLDDSEVDAISQLSDGRLLFSFTGSFSLPGASGKDEDLVAFTPTSLGTNTAGTWEFYFDGGDVGLSDGGAEDIDAFAVGPEGEMYFSTPGNFSVPGISGTDNDVFVFQPTTLGPTTGGDFSTTLFFEGAARDLNGLDIKGIDVPSVPPVPNDPPVAADDAAVANEDQTITINVLSNDSDPNSDPLSVASLDTLLTAGSVSINLDNTVEYTPPANLSGVDTFGYTISDGRGGTAMATVTVTVNPVNDAPTFSLPANPDQAVLLNAGQQTVVGFASNISTGPLDESGQVLQFLVTTDNDSLFSTLPEIDPNTGNLTFTAAAGITGTATVFVQLMDDGGTAQGGQDTSAVQTFSINVSLAAAPPLAVDDLATTNEDQSVTINVLTGDSDPNNDPLSVVSLDTTLTVGSASVNPNNTVDYTPPANFNGTDTFEYTISDGQGGTAMATVTVTVNPVNDTPTFSLPASPDQAVLLDAGQQTVVGFASNISTGPLDESGQILQFLVTTDNDSLFSTQPVINPNTGNLTFTASAGITGTASVSVQLMDDGGIAQGGQDTSAVLTFSVNVSLAAAPPLAVDDLATTNEDQTVTINVLTGDSDPNNDPLSVVSLDTTLTAGSASVNPNNTVDYTPPADFNGTDTFEYTISDGHGGFDSATVTVTVNSVNDLPTVATPIDDVNVIEDATDTVLDLSATFADVDIATAADVLSLSIYDNTNSGLVSATLVGTELTLSYASGQTGAATITIRAEDLSGAMVDATFQVIISPLAGSTDVLYFAVDDEGSIGSLTVDEADIVAFDGIDFRLLLDGSDIGLSGLKIDALDVISPSEILLSFAKNGNVPGIGTIADEDVIKFTATELGDNTAGTFEMYFDGSDIGLASNDVDAISLLDDGRLLLSTTGSYSLSGAGGKDEDLFAFTPTSLGDVTAGTFEIYFDGSDVGLSNGGAEDTDAAAVSSSGLIYLSTPGTHSVSGAMGGDNDVLVFTPTSTGGTTSGAFDSQPLFSGAAEGLGSLDIKALDVPNSLPALAFASAPPSEPVHVHSSSLTSDTVDRAATIQAAVNSSIARPNALRMLQAKGIQAPTLATENRVIDQAILDLSVAYNTSSEESTSGAAHWEQVINRLAANHDSSSEIEIATADEFFASFDLDA